MLTSSVIDINHYSDQLELIVADGVPRNCQRIDGCRGYFRHRVIYPQSDIKIALWIFKWMLDFVQTKGEPRWHGWVYVAIASVALFIRGLCFLHKDYVMIKFSLRVRSLLSSCILQKVTVQFFVIYLDL